MPSNGFEQVAKKGVRSVHARESTSFSGSSGPVIHRPREDQAALVLLELSDDDPPDELDEEDDDPLVDEDDPESDEDEEDDEEAEAVSLLAGTVLVPVERLSFR